MTDHYTTTEFKPTKSEIEKMEIISNVLDMNVVYYANYGTVGFTVGFETELNAYKAAYRYQNIQNKIKVEKSADQKIWLVIVSKRIG